ncbi:sensor histidine kinase [Streptomyces sp. NPDC057325]|uniref:sensor histidine kinase n=1 Tax=unclassified Streptomyces TaxID=2593676 RepID=UPI00362F474F
MIIRALAWLRGVQFLLWIWVPFTDGGPGRFAPQVLAGYFVAALFSVALFTVAVKRDTLSARWVCADVVLAVVYAIVVSRSYPPVEAASITNWVIPPLCGVTVTAAIYGGRYRVPAVVLVVGAWVVGAWPALGTDSSTELLSNSVMMALFAGVAGITGKLLFEAAGGADRAAAETAVERGRAERASERERQIRHLHDTVLQTLEGIAQGARGSGLDEVRRICGAEAEAQRATVLAARPDGTVASVVQALAVMVQDHPAQKELHQVITKFDSRLPDLPAEVVEVLTGATREALNNIVKYARTDEARVTAALLEPGGIKVTVVDHGVGFDAGTTPPGFGARRSILEPVAGIGGKAFIDSAPGEGTIVEMTWTP